MEPEKGNAVQGKPVVDISGQGVIVGDPKVENLNGGSVLEAPDCHNDQIDGKNQWKKGQPGGDILFLDFIMICEFQYHIGARNYSLFWNTSSVKRLTALFATRNQTNIF